MPTLAARRIGAAAAALWLAAVAYFSLSAMLTLEWNDEGHLVYNAWLVAEGALPYREFQHSYTPSSFFVNGLLLRWFGTDLMVIRAGLVLVKATIVALAFHAACQLAALRVAAALAVLSIVLWGIPLWALHSPYASHYALLCCLVGLLGFVRLRRHPVAGAAAAGLCFGLAATFKQITGVFGLLAFGLAVLTAAEVEHGTRTHRPWADAGGRAVRVGWLLCAVGVAAGFLIPNDTWWNGMLLGVPWAAACGVAIWREASTRGGASPRRVAAALCAAAAAAAVPALLYAAFYAWHGLLHELALNPVALPRRFRWLVPVARPSVGAAAACAALLVILSAPRWLPLLGLEWSTRLRRWLVGVCTGVIAAGLWFGGSRYLLGPRWTGDLIRLLTLAPVLVGWGTIPSMVRLARTAASGWPGAALTAAQRAGAQYHFFAASGLLSLYPVADTAHALMILPALVPSLAWLITRLGGNARGRAANGWTGALAGVAVLGVVCLPLVRTLASALDARRAVPVSFARARGITDAAPWLADAAEVVTFLETRAPERGLFVASGGQMFYFLSGRRSVVERQEFVLYLVGFGVISDADARALVSDAELAERLRLERPLVVERVDTPTSARLRAVFPAAAGVLEERYLVVQRFGPFRVLESIR